MLAPYDDLSSLDGWLLEQGIAQANSGISVENQLVPETVEKLGQPCAYLYATLIFDGEVSNGGLQQFFDNSSGALATMVRDALREMQMPTYADALTEIIDAFGPDYPRQSWDRSEAIDASPLLQERMERDDDIIDVWSKEFILGREQYARRSKLIK